MATAARARREWRRGCVLKREQIGERRLSWGGLCGPIHQVVKALVGRRARVQNAIAKGTADRSARQLWRLAPPEPVWASLSAVFRHECDAPVPPPSIHGKLTSKLGDRQLVVVDDDDRLALLIILDSAAMNLALRNPLPGVAVKGRTLRRTQFRTYKSGRRDGRR